MLSTSGNTTAQDSHASNAKANKTLRFEDEVDNKPSLSRAPGGPSSAYLNRRRSSLPALRSTPAPKVVGDRVKDDSSAFPPRSRHKSTSPSSSAFSSLMHRQQTPRAAAFADRSSSVPEHEIMPSSDRDFLTGGLGDSAVPQRRRSSTSSTASLAALASAATYTQTEIYGFLLVSKEISAAAEFICQLLQLGGFNDEILLSEFKTILIDLMAERFSEVWDIRSPRKGANFRTIQHSPNHPAQNVDPILQNAFALCNIHPKHLSALLPVSFTLTINPGLVAYTTTDVQGFQPVHLFEARPYLPPKHQEPVDHGAEIRLRAIKSVELGRVKMEDFDVDSYFGGRANVPARRPSVSDN